MSLLSRYDAQALRPPDAPADRPMTQAVQDASAFEPWQPILDWCLEGASRGPAPGGPPRPARPFAIALLHAADRAALSAFANALCLHLDGSVTLAERPGAAARLAYRLQVKLQEACWWRARQRDDPWDCGWAAQTTASAARLHSFEPRRSTLVVMFDAPDAKESGAQAPDRSGIEPGASLAQLAARRGGWRHAVRVLVLSDAPTGPAGPLERLRELPLPGPITPFAAPASPASAQASG